MTKEERAEFKSKHQSNEMLRTGFEAGYIIGATEQQEIDIEKLKDVMNRLMIDTHDKAEIIKAMEE